MDILDIYAQFKDIADECRDEQKPAFVDIRTYRYKGHSMSDPQKYRTREEVESYEKEKDSIALLVGHLMRDRKCLSEDQWAQMQDEIREQVLAAVKFAEEAPEPGDDELYSDVYVNPLPQMSPTRDYTIGERNHLLKDDDA
jgi:pyruvate dehydrogenase E1 component alpha subunit